MKLTAGDKVVVCRKYDSLLSTLLPLEKLMTPPLYPNLINYDDYNTGSEEEHKLHISLMASEIAASTGIQDPNLIEEYIKKPDFFPKLNVRKRTIDKHIASIEDTILYRNVYETTILNTRKKTFKFGK